MYSEGVEDQNYLRGAQIADDDGIVRFKSIFPACYSGRWPHIHFEVYPDRESITDSANAIATSQVALPKAVCDKVYATTATSSPSEPERHEPVHRQRLQRRRRSKPARHRDRKRRQRLHRQARRTRRHLHRTHWRRRPDRAPPGGGRPRT